MRLRNSENVLQQELVKFEDFCTKNKLVINSKKSFVMLFSRSRTLAFPPEFSIGNGETMNKREPRRRRIKGDKRIKG